MSEEKPKKKTEVEIDEECLAKSKAEHGDKNHADVARDMNNLGMAYVNANQVDKGLEMLMNSLKMFNELHENADNEIEASVANNIGTILQIF